MTNRSPRPRIGILAALAASLVIAACSSGSASSPAAPAGGGSASPAGGGTGQLTKVKIAYPAISQTSHPLWIAKEIGAFEKYGIDAELVFVEGGRVVSGLLSKATPIAIVPGANVLDPAAAGADIVSVMSMGSKATDMIMGGQGITKPEDLKGKAAGVNEPGGETDKEMRYALEKLGLKPDSDVQVVSVGGESTRVAALKSGSVQATIVDNALAGEMKELGATELYNFLDSDLEYQKAVVATTKGFLADNRETVENVLKGFLEGVAYYKAHKAESVDIAAKYSEAIDKSALEDAWDRYAPDFPDVAYVSEDGLRTLQDFTQDEKVKAIDVKSVVDNSVLKDIESSGFLDTLGK